MPIKAYKKDQLKPDGMGVLTLFSQGRMKKRTAVVNDDNWETKKLCEEQQKDEDIKPFIAWKEEGTRPEWKDISNKSTTLKGYWAIWDSLIVEDGILKRLLGEHGWQRNTKANCTSEGESQ
ncbi:hypothetical protein NQ317_001249 [Molorchus minor]|uniref:Uncharacterized protein n=1 Tax=Molorchus minor TaxID=1323400 RepID=A0ABQ9J260_9CUCU|nr:hypothetical protein NQ317_001249 [Molorchus minor]